MNIEWWQILIFIILNGAASFFGAYIKEKAKSTVTKEDVKEITEKIESVKLDIKNMDRIQDKKYQIKYNACINMLSSIDVHLSFIMNKDNNGKKLDNVNKQYISDIEEMRKCHNKLLLSIDNNDIIKTFLEILQGKTNNPVISLNKIRQLVREELGFKGKVYIDKESTWLAVANYTKTESKK